MPEGDTILRAARTLESVLAGREVTRICSPRVGFDAAAERHHLVGSRIERVEARGKHLLIRFSTGAALHTHLRMHGSWHTYRRGSRWRKPGHLARVVIEAGNVLAVCFEAPVVEILSAAEESRHPALSALGPDLLAPTFLPAAARSALRARADLEAGVALLDQRALAGIGNVYKSEVLFLCGVSPFAKVATLSDTVLDRLISTAAQQLRRNLAGGGRRTTSTLAPGALWVYRRAGASCRRCGTRIARRLQGEDARATYYCRRCQAVG